MTLGLRLRVALAFAAASMLVVGLLGIGLYLASERMEEALVDQIVGEELEVLAHRGLAAGTAMTDGPNLQYYAVADAHDPVLPPSLRGLAPGMHEIGEGPGELHVGVKVRDGLHYVVAYDAGPHEQREADFRALVWLSLAGIAAASLALGYGLSGLLTRQVTDLAQRVSRLDPASAAAPLSRPGQEREVAALARALDAYQERINALIAREQEFTTDASHELRTPLTAIVTSCELLLETPGLDERARDRVRMIAAAAGRMSEQIETLLLLAREQSPALAQTFALADCIDDVAAPLAAELARRQLALDIDVPRDALVTGDRQALHTVLANLLRNAVQHTRQGRVRVAYAAGGIAVSDTGAGIAAEHLPRLFDRYYRTGNRHEGLGVGLAIVKRLCDHHGWGIAVDSAPGKGSTFTVALGPDR